MMKMILADDEITIRQGYSKLISKFDLDVVIAGVACDGLEALNLIREVKPELILIDVNMPKMDGLTVVAEIIEILPHSKIIIISGYDQYSLIRQALRLGVFDYLLKPVRHSVLYQTLSDAIRAYQKDTSPSCALPPPGNENDLADTVLSYIHSRYADPGLNLTELAGNLYVSSSVLSRAIKQKTGQNFTDYLNDLRIRQAIALLEQPGPVMIYAIAEQVGYSSQHYFCRIFKEHVGKTPSAYRTDFLNRKFPAD